MREVSRRDLLRWGAGATAGGVLAVAGCDGPGSHRGGPTTSAVAPSTSTSPASPPDDAAWAMLASSLTGRLVRPSDRGYTTDVQLFDSRYDGVRPAGIAYCASPTDVQRCLAFVRNHDLAVAARSGGHSYAGYSTGTGLVVDVTRMATVTASGGQATVGAGARLIDVYTALNGQGLSIPAGSCPTVGIAGLALGGGDGVVSRTHGLTCDAVTSLQVVTADGRVVTADAQTNSDLFWGSRGGGGGNFGIVTSFSLSTFPTSEVATFFLTWPWAGAADVLPAWFRWAPTGPDALWSNLIMQTDPSKPAAEIQVGGVWLGSASGLAPLINQLVSSVGSSPSSQSVENVPFGHAMYIEAGCASLSEAACHLPTEASGGTLTRQPSLAKSDYFSRPLSDGGVEAILAGINGRRQQGGKGAVGFDAYGGAINRVPASATAFVHRSAIASAQYSVPFTPADSSSSLASGEAWLNQWYATLRPYADGQAYQNYIDPDLKDWEAAYYGANFPRLQQVKKAWDPDNLFHFAQSIPLP